jgi:hypothetical protein
LTYFVEFHVCVKNFSSSVDCDSSQLVNKEFLLGNHLNQTLADFEKFPEYERFFGGIAGLLDDFKNAAFANKSRKCLTIISYQFIVKPSALCINLITFAPFYFPVFKALLPSD